jgi:hypothetical protein
VVSDSGNTFSELESTEVLLMSRTSKQFGSWRSFTIMHPDIFNILMRVYLSTEMSATQVLYDMSTHTRFLNFAKKVVFPCSVPYASVNFVVSV